MSTPTKDLLLVGSIPLDTVQDVFETCADLVGDHVPYIPDGEVGDRIWWVNYLAYRVFNGHPDITTLNRPSSVDGYPQWKPTDLVNIWEFTLKPATKTLRFLDLDYATAAHNSYGIFCLLREAGKIPKDVKFLVCLPLTNSASDWFFRNPADYPLVHTAYEEVMGREIQKMLERIPAHDLVIQWDVCFEILDIEGLFPYTPQENKFARNTEAIAHLSPQIPQEVELGYHWCYGTLGGWPMKKPENLKVSVELSNYAVAHSGRRVDYVHMPAPRHCSEAYFAPLRDLEIEATKVYLGLIHETDDVENNLKRAEVARKFLPRFGLSSVCGYGRRPPDEVPRILRLHRDVMQALS